LAAAVCNAGGHAVFVMRDLPGNMLVRVADLGFEVRALPAPASGFLPTAKLAHAAWAGVSGAQDAAETAQILACSAWNWLVVDHYAFDLEWEVAARPDGARLMAIDDLADRAHDCDLLLDQNLGRRARDYDVHLPARTRRLIGPAYALLRPEFASLRQSALAARGGPLRHVLIAMGGIDAPDVTSVLLQALPDTLQVTVVMGSAAPALDRVRALAQARGARLLVDTPDMAQVMASVDLAIGGVGVSAWERCVLGLPSLMVVMADNQEPAAAALATTGAARLIGRAGDVDLPARLRVEIAALSDGGVLETMAARAAALCDGRGLPRVLRALGTPPLRLRTATLQDAALVWHWRAGLAGTMAFRNADIPPLGAHMEWFSRALTLPSHRLYMAETAGDGIIAPVGHLRLDDANSPGTALVSILLDTAARAQGIGAALLAAAEAEARYLNLTALVADVHKDNTASRALFSAAGYVQHGQDGHFLRLGLAL
jgi:UDP-2,4-diacetamido-2,4,6-trideoxy-beta-L-altropyranose hydrolase